MKNSITSKYSIDNENTINAINNKAQTLNKHKRRTLDTKNQLIDNRTEKVLKNTEVTNIVVSNAGSTSGLSNQVEVNSYKTNQETKKKPVHLFKEQKSSKI